MSRIEFIDTLRTILAEELPAGKVEESILYYEEYIKSMGNEHDQEEEINRIGEPHLIAQTIIDSYKMSGQFKYTGQSEQMRQEYRQSEGNTVDYGTEYKQTKKNSLWENIKSACTIICVVAIMIILFRFAFNLFIRVGLPLFACYLLICLIKSFFSK